MTPPIRPELINDMVDAYVDWREEAVALRDAYERWSSGSDPERGLAFAAYRAALDREQQASFVYADRSRRVERELTSKPGLLRRLWQSGGARPAIRPIETTT
jgi:hypothetical protein